MDDVMPLRRKKCRIDGLPDELLIAILSCLNFLEAARTSILSRRWRYLWKHITCSLEFYSQETYKIQRAEKFITAVTQVLKLHQGAFIDQFKVYFTYPIDCVAGEQREKIDRAIDGWIDFAIGKRVKVFELNLRPRFLGNESTETYSFPHVQKLLSISGEVKLQRTLLTLKSVRFVKVRITQEVVEFLLSNCPFLEQVCISASDSLENLEVGGSLPKLRSMEISHCKYLKSVKVRAPSLVSFTYITLGCMLTLPPFEEVPLLSELTAGYGYAHSFLFAADMHSSYCRNLKKLKLEVPYEVSYCCKVIPDEFPQLCRLKKLELDITTKFGYGLCYFTFLTKCSPQLSRLTIRLTFLPIYSYYKRHAVHGYGFWNDDFEELMAKERKTDRIAQEAMTFCHKCLKVVKMVGFIGCPSDYELALHLLRIAGSLKRMTLYSDTDFDTLHEFWPSSMRKRAIRECVDQLKANLPPEAELLTYGRGFPKK